MTLFLIILLASEVSSLTLRKPKHRWWNDLSDDFYPADCCNIVLIEFLSSFSKQTNNFFCVWLSSDNYSHCLAMTSRFPGHYYRHRNWIGFLNFGIIWLTLKSLHGQSIGMVLMTNGWMVFLKGYLFSTCTNIKISFLFKSICMFKKTCVPI